jgi:predicted PurR-regulated permease PerM
MSVPSIPPAPSSPSPPPPPSAPPDSSLTGIPPAKLTFRRFARLWGFVLFFVVLAYLFREVLLPFVFAVLIAYILAPYVTRLSRLHVGKRHLPRGVSVLICYAVLIVGMGVFFVAFLPRVTADVAKLGAEAPRMWERMQNEWVPSVARFLDRHFPAMTAEPESAPPPALVADLPPPPGTALTVVPLANGDYAITLPPNGIEIERTDDKRVVVKPHQVTERRRFEELVRDKMDQLVRGLEGEVAEVLKFGQALIIGILSVLIQLVIVLLVAAYLLIDLDRIHAFVRSVFPERYRGDYDAVVKGIDRGLGGVIRGQLVVCLFNGVLAWIGLAIFGVKYAILLAALVAFFSLIPIFGTIISTIPCVLVALVSEESGVDMTRGLVVLAWILGVHFLEANFFSPKILGHQARIHPVLVIFALIAGGHTFGVVGAVLAVPVASIGQTLFFYFRSRAWKLDTSAVTRSSG